MSVLHSQPSIASRLSVQSVGGSVSAGDGRHVAGPATTASTESITLKNRRWILNTFKRRECGIFVAASESAGPLLTTAPSDGDLIAGRRKPRQSNMCCCGRTADQHVICSSGAQQASTVPEGTPWSWELNTIPLPTDAFGTVEFLGGAHPTKAQYIRLSIDTQPELALELMQRIWGLDPPKMLISVHGGMQNFDLQAKLKRVFRRGLLRASGISGAWIVTNGTHQGVTLHVGDALSSRPANLAKRIVSIGIAPWGVIENRHVLLNRTPPADPDIKVYHSGAIPQNNFCVLNPYHTHFLLVDNGTTGKHGADVSFRKELEKYISGQRVQTSSATLEAIMESPRQHPERLRGSRRYGKGYKVPWISLVVEGGLHTIRHVLDCVTEEPQVPVVILDGSGRAADLFGFIHKYMDDDDQLPELLANQLLITIANTFGLTNENEARNVLNEIISACHYRHNLITVYRLGENITTGGVATNVKDAQEYHLDSALLIALLQAQKASAEDQLSLAMQWDRVDIARSHIFVYGQRWRPDSLSRALFDALQLDLVEFVDLLLTNGINMGDWLTLERLEDLYNVQTGPANTLRYLVQDVRDAQASSRGVNVAGVSVAGERRVTLIEIGFVIEALMGAGYRSRYLQRRFKDDLAAMRRRRHERELRHLNREMMRREQQDRRKVQEWLYGSPMNIRRIFTCQAIAEAENINSSNLTRALKSLENLDERAAGLPVDNHHHRRRKHPAESQTDEPSQSAEQMESARQKDASKQNGNTVETKLAPDEYYPLNEQGKFRYPYNELIVWAVLMKRQRMARYMWRRGEESLAKALVACRLYKAMAWEAADDDLDPDVCQELKSYSREFRKLAVDFLDYCYKRDNVTAMSLLTYELRLWSKQTCLSLAVMAKHKEFLSHPCCQLLLNDLWMGGLRIRKNTSLKVVLSLLCPVFVPFLQFKSQHQLSMQPRTIEEYLNASDSSSSSSSSSSSNTSYVNPIENLESASPDMPTDGIDAARTATANENSPEKSINLKTRARSRRRRRRRRRPHTTASSIATSFTERRSMYRAVSPQTLVESTDGRTIVSFRAGAKPDTDDDFQEVSDEVRLDMQTPLEEVGDSGAVASGTTGFGSGLIGSTKTALLGPTTGSRLASWRNMLHINANRVWSRVKAVRHRRRKASTAVGAQVAGGTTGLAIGTAAALPQGYVLDHLLAKKDPPLRFTKKFYEFYAAPITTFWSHCFGYLIFLAVFTYLVLVELDHRVSFSECYVALYVLSYSMERMRQFVQLEPTRWRKKCLMWLDNRWHWFEMLLIMMFACGFSLRWWTATMQSGRLFYCLDVSLWYIGLLNLFSVNKYLGPYVTMIGKMMLDMMTFIVILGVVLISYGVANQAIRYPYEPWNWRLLRDVFYQPYFMLYGEVFADSIDPPCGPGEERECVTGQWAAPIIMTIYLLVANILLINLLIAVFNSTFDRVSKTAHQLWMFQRYSLVIEHEFLPLPPPPFILLYYLYLIVWAIKRWAKGKFIQLHKDSGLKLFLSSDALEKIHDFEEDAMVEFVELIEKNHQESSDQLIQNIREQCENVSLRMEDVHRNENNMRLAVQTIDYRLMRVDTDLTKMKAQVQSALSSIWTEQQLIRKRLTRISESSDLGRDRSAKLDDTDDGGDVVGIAATTPTSLSGPDVCTVEENLTVHIGTSSEIVRLEEDDDKITPKTEQLGTDVRRRPSTRAMSNPLESSAAGEAQPSFSEERALIKKRERVRQMSLPSTTSSRPSAVPTAGSTSSSQRMASSPTQKPMTPGRRQRTGHRKSVPKASWFRPSAEKYSGTTRIPATGTIMTAVGDMQLPVMNVSAAAAAGSTPIATTLNAIETSLPSNLLLASTPVATDSPPLVPVLMMPAGEYTSITDSINTQNLGVLFLRPGNQSLSQTQAANKSGPIARTSSVGGGSSSGAGGAADPMLISPGITGPSLSATDVGLTSARSAGSSQPNVHDASDNASLAQAQVASDAEVAIYLRNAASNIDNADGGESVLASRRSTGGLSGSVDNDPDDRQSHNPSPTESADAVPAETADMAEKSLQRELGQILRPRFRQLSQRDSSLSDLAKEMADHLDEQLRDPNFVVSQLTQSDSTASLPTGATAAQRRNRHYPNPPLRTVRSVTEEDDEDEDEDRPLLFEIGSDDSEVIFTLDEQPTSQAVDSIVQAPTVSSSAGQPADETVSLSNETILDALLDDRVSAGRSTSGNAQNQQ